MAGSFKQALVIGNEDYVLNPISMCVNDATDMAMTLQSIGFQVQSALNQPLNSMLGILNQFIASIQPGSIVMLYYSGHGIQYNGVNYLMPVDDQQTSLQTLEQTAINIDELLKAMYMRSPRVMIVVLDACRAFLDDSRDGSRLNFSFRFHRNRPVGFKDGLAPMQAPPATIVAYACAADQFSTTQSMNGRNSLYTYHLLRHICTPNCDIDFVLRSVAADVQRDPTNEDRQTPFRYSSCNETIHLVTPGQMSMSMPMSPMDWQQGSPYQSYPNQYMKASDAMNFYHHMNNFQYHFLMPPHYRRDRRKQFFDMIQQPIE